MFTDKDSTGGAPKVSEVARADTLAGSTLTAATPAPEKASTPAAPGSGGDIDMSLTSTTLGAGATEVGGAGSTLTAATPAPEKALTPAAGGGGDGSSGSRRPTPLPLSKWPKPPPNRGKVILLHPAFTATPVAGGGGGDNGKSLPLAHIITKPTPVAVAGSTSTVTTPAAGGGGGNGKSLTFAHIKPKATPAPEKALTPAAGGAGASAEENSARVFDLTTLHMINDARKINDLLLEGIYQARPELVMAVLDRGADPFVENDKKEKAADIIIRKINDSKILKIGRNDIMDSYLKCALYVLINFIKKNDVTAFEELINKIIITYTGKDPENKVFLQLHQKAEELGNNEIKELIGKKLIEFKNPKAAEAGAAGAGSAPPTAIPETPAAPAPAAGVLVASSVLGALGAGAGRDGRG